MSVVVMGILNVTPDSFSDGGRHHDVDRAVAHGRRLLAEGATIIDVGGESTRPGAVAVHPDAERDRTVPVIDALRDDVTAGGGVLSIDTRHADVAAAAVRAGARIINDVSASLDHVAADLGAGWIAMHKQGDPATMQHDPRYDDVVAEVTGALVAAAGRARARGVTDVWIDPGIGFGKTFADNWRLLGALDRLVATGVPVAIGTSRKGFLGDVLRGADGATHAPPTDDRIIGSVLTALWAATMGVTMIRVHDVAETVAALDAAGIERVAPHGDRGGAN